jgi:dihydropteroate synthase
MIVARLISADRTADLQLAFSRMGLPTGAREYLLEKLPNLQILLTGLTRTEGRFLRLLADRPPALGREEFATFVSGDVERRPGAGLLCGRRDQVWRIRDEAAREPALAELTAALDRALQTPSAPPALRLGDRTFDLGRRTLIMGVVNVTPDSFSDGGRFLDPERAVEQGELLARAGADLLDVGGESTRPGSDRVSAEEELRRVIPVIRGIRQRTGVPISIDTTRARVAEEALAAGAVMVNDISGLSFDPGLAKVVAAADAAICLMHIRGTPETMQQDPRYQDVVEEVLTFLLGASRSAQQAGVRPERILVDPGIGFGKTVGHNLLLLRRLVDLRQLGHAVVVGTSRKSFLGAVTGGKPVGERLWATLGSAATLAAQGGCDVLRVHDVAECRDAILVADAVRNATEAGEAFLPLAARG